jgi:hypothetical protein
VFRLHKPFTNLAGGRQQKKDKKNTREAGSKKNTENRGSFFLAFLRYCEAEKKKKERAEKTEKERQKKKRLFAPFFCK